MADGKAESVTVLSADNVRGTLDAKGILTIVIDTGKRLRQSREGKSMIIASTGGNRAVTLPNGSGFKIGLNCYMPMPTVVQPTE